MRIELWQCDRCKREFRGYSGYNGINYVGMQIPYGTVLCLDKMESSKPRELCKSCAESFNYWWRNPMSEARAIQGHLSVIRAALTNCIGNARDSVAREEQQQKRMPLDHDNNDMLEHSRNWLTRLELAMVAMDTVKVSE